MPGDGEVIVFDAGSGQWIAAPRPGGSLLPPVDPTDDGKVPVASAGNFIYTNAPTLVSVTATSFLAIGSTPPSSGALRMTDGDQIRWSNGGGGVREVLKSTGEAVVLGDTSQTGSTNIFGGGGGAAGVSITVGATQRALLQASSSDFLGLGAILPSAGTIRIAHGSSIMSVDSGGGSNRNVLEFGVATNDNITLGDSNVTCRYNASSTGHAIQTSGTARLAINSTAVAPQAGVNLTWASAHTGPTINQENLGSGPGATLTVQAQNASSGIGGSLTLSSGTGTTTAGEVIIKRGATNVIATNASNQITIASSGGISLANSVSCGSSLSINGGGGNTWSLVGGTSIGGAGPANKSISAGVGSMATGPSFTISGWDTNAGNQTGGAVVLRAGDSTGSGMGTTLTGGALTLRAGDATGASGTRNGGNAVIRAGNGADAQGYVEIQTGGGTGRIRVDATGIGFFNVTPVARPAAYTPTNVTPDRSYDADTVVVAELADVVGTLIADLQAYGLLQ
jgi:hypothetical protein